MEASVEYKEILSVLNNIGYSNISADQLKEFTRGNIN